MTGAEIDSSVDAKDGSQTASTRRVLMTASHLDLGRTGAPLGHEAQMSCRSPYQRIKGVSHDAWCEVAIDGAD